MIRGNISKALFCVSVVSAMAATPALAGATGNGWSQSNHAADQPAVQSPTQPPIPSQQTWILHGRKVSCDSKQGWVHTEYKAHCRNGAPR